MKFSVGPTINLEGKLKTYGFILESKIFYFFFVIKYKIICLGTRIFFSSIFLPRYSYSEIQHTILWEKIISPFLVKCAVSVFVCLDFKYDTHAYSFVTVGNAFISFTVLLLFMHPFSCFIYLFYSILLIFSETMWIPVHTYLCVATPLPWSILVSD